MNEKYRDCKEVLSKYIINSNNFFVKIKSMLIKAINILYQAFFFALT